MTKLAPLPMPFTYRRNGLFRCVGYGLVGIGYDEEHAFIDWWHLVRRAWLMEALT
jgi:hypothetical protein